MIGNVCIILLAAMLWHQAIADCKWKEDRSMVICAMKTIEQTELEVATGSTRLMINCDSSLMYESVIPRGIFKKQEALEELYVEACKVLHIQNETFAGLQNLRILRLSTLNAEWGQSNKLEIESGAFASFNNLQSLSLVANNLRILPKNILCSIKRLTYLNLSENRIRSTGDLGFSACQHLNGLKSIDLSYNELFALDANWTTSDLRSVESLTMQNNNLTKLSSNSLDMLPALKVLNLSSNYLETLPDGLFGKTVALQEIHLQNNKIYQLPLDAFVNLPELLVLDLSDNQLSSHYIDAAIFSQLRRLVILNLSNNALTRIDSHTFSELNFLQILDLKNNSIGFVDVGAFLPLTNLHTLNLSGNRLHIVNNGLFNGLFVLTRLVLNNNLITIVETSAFKNCSSLKELDLSSNQLSDVPQAISDLHMLKSLDLGENRIAILKNDSFRNLHRLTGLRLMDNLIVNLTYGILDDLPKLNVLNLARNKIQSIERGAFDKTREIEAIRLDKNLLIDINGIFATLNSLLWLNLSENQLEWFDYAFIPMNLKWLDIHGNYIEALGNYYKLENEITVTTLDASHNRIAEIGPTSVPNSIELFFVNNNLIRNIYPNTFLDKINLTRVDLYSNSISKLHLHSIRIAAMLRKKSSPEFYLGGNPFECDCSMGWLKHHDHHQQQPPQHPKIMDYSEIECLVSHKRNTPVRLVSTLTHSDFLCRFEHLCPATCHCCEQKVCHCNIKCPDNCSCFHDQIGAITKVNCGKQNLLTMPEKMPADTTTLYADGNNYFELKNYAFGQLKKLQNLYLNNSNVITIQPNTMTGLPGLHKLHLDDNKLTVLYGYEFNQLSNLRELYLHDNLLTYIENTTFSMLPLLQILRLDGNRISTLTTWQMQSGNLKNMKSLTLADNLWSCGCEFLQEFITFVYDSDVVIKDAQSLYCIDGDVKKIINSNLTIVCKGFDSVVVLPEGIPHGYVPLLGFALTIIFVLAVLVAVFTIKEQMCCAYGNEHTKQTPGTVAKTLYDTLILTALEDSEFLYTNLCTQLKQHKPTIRIGLQYKNITNANVQTCAQRSQKIIIYLTNNFLQTEWTRPEIRAAIANSWMPGKVILVQTPNVNFLTNSDRELINNVGRGIVHLKTWEIDFTFKLLYAIDNPPFCVQQINQPAFPAAQSAAEQIWKSQNSKIINSYAYVIDEMTHDKNDSYYSSATAESVLTTASPMLISKCNVNLNNNNNVNHHVYAGIDSDYGSVTNEDSIVSVVHHHNESAAAATINVASDEQKHFENDNNGYLV